MHAIAGALSAAQASVITTANILLAE